MDKLTLVKKKKCIFKIDFYFFNITLGQHTNMYNMEKIGFKVILMTIVELIDAIRNEKNREIFLFPRTTTKTFHRDHIYVSKTLQRWLSSTTMGSSWQFIGGPL